MPAVTPDAPKLPEVANAVNVAEVKLSPRGFIQTFDDLKSQLKTQYPDASKMPTGVKHFVETPSTKLAQEYGFWDVKAGKSGMGLAGENLAVDADGHLKLEHLATAGKAPVTETIGTGDKSFEAMHGDKMFTPKASAVHEGAPTPDEVPHPTTQPAINTEELIRSEHASEIHGDTASTSQTLDNDSAYPGITEPNPISLEHGHVLPPPPLPDNGAYPMHAPNTVFPEHIPAPQARNVISSFDHPLGPDGSAGNIHVSVVEVAGGQKNMMVEVAGKTFQAGESVKLPNGETGMKLLDQYQNGKQFEPIREAFVDAQKRLDISYLKSASKCEFEGGMINIAHNLQGNQTAIRVFLNGKEIAKGLVNNEEIAKNFVKNQRFGENLVDIRSLKLTIDPKLHHPLLRPDTVYDRAMKEIRLKGRAFVWH